MLIKEAPDYDIFLRQQDFLCASHGNDITNESIFIKWTVFGTLISRMQGSAYLS